MANLEVNKIIEIQELLTPPIEMGRAEQIREILNHIITGELLNNAKEKLKCLVGVQIDILQLPEAMLKAFEPSQIGTIVGTIMDAAIPELKELLPNDENILRMAIVKHEGILGDREGYPDYKLDTGERLELKLIYIDPIDAIMKKPPTPREPSARLTQKVTFKNVNPEKDILLVLAYQLQPNRLNPKLYSPTIINVGVFPVVECILARDLRLAEAGGRWFGTFETPTVLSNKGKKKLKDGVSLSIDFYGRKESENRDYNEDTNFGKLKRIPYEPLQEFLRNCGANSTMKILKSYKTGSSD